MFFTLFRILWYGFLANRECLEAFEHDHDPTVLREAAGLRAEVVCMVYIEFIYILQT
jgi:hypothetical protein